MRISATGTWTNVSSGWQANPYDSVISSNARLRGFTLIELLVVILIIGTIMSFAVLSVSNSGDKEVETEAKRLQALVRLASDESVMNAVDMMLRLYKRSYEFAMIGPDGIATPIDDEEGSFRRRELPGDASLRAIINGEEVKLATAPTPEKEKEKDAKDDGEDKKDKKKSDQEDAPTIFILSSGELTPFTLFVENSDGAGFAIEGDFMGDVQFLGREKK